MTDSLSHGPAKETANACCSADEQAKAAGATDCGCAARIESVKERPRMRLRVVADPDHLPALDTRRVRHRPAAAFGHADEHPPRILLLYGSLRERSYSRLVIEEAARLLRYFGAEPRIFDPTDLPFPDRVVGDDHPAVRELRELSMWSEGHIWCSPERHGQITGLMKAQIDHLPLNMRGLRPTQGRTLAVMQVCGGSQSFNAVNTLRLLGRWMRMFTIPNQSSVAKAFQEFDAAGRMRPSSYYERIVDVIEELVRFTILLRPHVATLTDRYSERKEVTEKADVTADLSAIATSHQRAEARMK
jgi:arsenic resistance protein ArsH